MKNELKLPAGSARLTEEEQQLTEGGATDPYFRKPENTFLSSVTAVLFGLSLIGGGVYSIEKWADVTEWAIPGGLAAMIAGASCTLRGAFQLIKSGMGK